MSINVLYVQGTSETLWPILRSLKIRSTFSAKRTMRKAFCQPKDQVATDVLRSRFIISILIQQLFPYIRSLFSSSLCFTNYNQFCPF